MTIKKPYMRNEFEKQVRQKMEELDFVPSSPVWEKIEVQIRNKKDRRRLILWLPLLTLMISGGIWWMQSNQKVSSREVSQKNNAISKTSTVSPPTAHEKLNSSPSELNDKSKLHSS